MALLLPRSVFIHVPKTGGSWVRAAVRNAGIQTQELGCSWHEGDRCDHSYAFDFRHRIESPHVCWHNRYCDVDAGGRFVFAFVRHPVSYYRSHWSYKTQHGWDERSAADRELKADSLEGFVRKVLERRPRGWVSGMYRNFLLREGKMPDFVGYQERLADDLVRALRLAGETFDEDALRATPPVNTSAVAADLLPTALAAEVLARESFCRDMLLYAEEETAPEAGCLADHASSIIRA